jgi:Tol biopolymer transport system component
VLAVSRRGQTVIGVPGGTPRRLLPSGFAVAAGAFAPDGDRLVAEGPLASLWVVDVSTGHRRRVWRSPAPYGSVGPPFPGTWSPDGRWVLFHTDSGHSASIAADGTPLWAVPAAGGPAVRVEPTVLDNADFVQRCGPSAIVVSAGEDRYVSHDKRVDVAAPATWKPHTISDDPGRSWYAAACSPDGALVAATVTANAPEAMFDTAQRSIWLLSTRGGAHRLLVRPATGISVEEPRFANDGNWILYLQHPARPYPVARLYLVNVHTGARRGPYGQIAGGLGYYGQHGWDDLAPWYQPAA